MTTDPLADYQHTSLRQAYEAAWESVPDHVRDQHDTLAEMVAALAAWPDRAVAAIEAERERVSPDQSRYPRLRVYRDALDFAAEAVRGVE